jgi:phage terminase large subunit-like protein
VWNEKIQSWDMAFKKTTDSDFVVGQTWARLGANVLPLRERRGRMGFSETKKAVRRGGEGEARGRAKLIEDKANGPAIIDELRDAIDGLVA